ncbi:MAG: hypothetical protein LBS97_07360 [Treponema sp.]|jgi:hypothetical protein|nr:hypothetical protein [Treponema sp.]
MKCVPVIFLILALLVCCKADNAPEDGELLKTLREQIQVRDVGTQWTLDFQKKQPSSPQGRQIPLTLENIAAASIKFTGNRMYPELPGFGSLDTSNLNREQRTLLNNFCQAVTGDDREKAAETFNQSTRFLLTLFFADIQNAGLNSFIIGKPVVAGQTWQVPVRFFASKSRLDVQMYLLYDTKSWIIDQIAYGELIHE